MKFAWFVVICRDMASVSVEILLVPVASESVVPIVVIVLVSVVALLVLW